LSRDEIAGLVAGEIIPEINRARHAERMKLRAQQGVLEDDDSYYTSVALFLVQEKFDNETRERKPVAHVICDADSDVAVYLETKSGKKTLLGLNLPHNIAGDRAKKIIETREQGFRDEQGKPIVTVQMVDSMSLGEIERIYR